ncbi:mitochondrial small ribosomal subunit Rsm22-domain-containing protein [Rhexocercosporidium sp. MPI-PUGE-AT-0058]|nr:mitochondrial small ribosomal subunit Rsm22-domain-containing protein [Rhexocercosporidium sp. MPI-PUGE-AT-0058]
MLSARKIPRACQSCRLQLLSLFENGFTNCAPANTARARYSSTRIQTQPRALPYRHTTLRAFSTTRKRAEEPKLDLPDSPAGGTDTGIEAVVRQARQTFGETLPKDYLSVEEYVLYERLYGPPLRETKPEDLEYLPEGEEEVDPDKVRNVLLRQNDQGEYEEVEFDPELGYSVMEEEMTSEETDEMYLASEELLAEDEGLAGELEQVKEGESLIEDYEEGVVASEEVDEDAVQIQGRNQREIDVIARLQLDMDAALAQPIEEEEEEIDEEYEEDEEEMEEEDEEEGDGTWISSDAVRTHPHTMTGRSGTYPTTLTFPKETFLAPISELLARANTKHVTEAAERVFGGKGLPYSASVPASKKMLPQKNIGLDAMQHKMSEIEADAYLAAVMPGTFASITNTLVEVRKRLGGQWVRDLIFREGGEGPRILDAGGAGAGVIAWREILQAEWDVMRDEGLVEGEQAPHGKTSVLTGSTALRHRISRFLDDTTFLPRLPEYMPGPSTTPHLDRNVNQPRKSYDIIIAPHTLFPLKEDFRRKNMVQNLWSLLDPNGGVLIIIEKGLPRGFEAIAGARSLLLESHISSPGETAIENEIQSPNSERARFTKKEEGMIIAPCTNHLKCPMYPVPGFSSGRKDFCHFPQRFIRPDYLQKVLGAKIRNHEDAKFSYIAVRRGVDARKTSPNPLQGEEATLQSLVGYEDHDLPESDIEIDTESSDVKFEPLNLPRIILPSLKRRGHVTLDLCTPSGKLERWTVPRSFSKAAYRDARKSSWGDLWALGAKTRTFRSPRLGRGGEEGGKVKGIRDGKMGKGGKKMKKKHYDMIMGKEGVAEIKEAGMASRLVKREKRTKGGRIWKVPKPLGEDDF